MYIYTISYSGSPELVRYVGKCTDPSNRTAVHKYKATKYQDSHISVEFGEVLKSGQELILTIIDECDESDWETKEDQYILMFRASGAPILNKARGGRLSGNGNKGQRNISAFKKVEMHSKDGKFIRLFDSVVDAANYINEQKADKLETTKHTISSVARGRRPSAFGFKWKYQC